MEELPRKAEIQVEKLLKLSEQEVRRVLQGIPAADGSLSNESRVGSERFCGCPQAGERVRLATVSML